MFVIRSNVVINFLIINVFISISLKEISRHEITEQSIKMFNALDSC